MKVTLPVILLFFFSCTTPPQPKESTPTKIIINDTHAHIMSPALIAHWKNMGIPFSKSEALYSDLDTILNNNPADHVDLIGMGYVYGSEEYYQEDDRYERMKADNDQLFQEAKKYPNRVTPFFTVDPLKDYALTELERCYQIHPKSGLKLHFNVSQVYLTEPEHVKKVKPIFQKAAEYGLPVLLHFDNWHPKFGKPDLEIFTDSILQKIPSIELRIAHFGTSGGFKKLKTSWMPISTYDNTIEFLPDIKFI